MHKGQLSLKTYMYTLNMLVVINSGPVVHAEQVHGCHVLQHTVLASLPVHFQLYIIARRKVGMSGQLGDPMMMS